MKKKFNDILKKNTSNLENIQTTNLKQINIMKIARFKYNIFLSIIIQKFYIL